MDQDLNQRQAKISVIEKIGYGLGDFGFNFYWVIIGSYLMYFYTDIFGISGAAAGTIFLVTKIFDAFTDPIIGGLADRTRTRWGKFRPYLLFAALPMAGAATLTLTTPDLGETGKLVWVFLSYSAMMLCYTLLNMPYNSLAGVLTADAEQRNKIFGLRFVFAYTAGIIVGTFTPKLAAYLGGGDEKLGWQLTMAVYSGVATLLFWICFVTTKERIHPPQQQKTTPFEDLSDLVKSRAWVVLLIISLIIMITLTLRGGSAPYFLKYFVQRPDLLGAYIGLQMAAYAIGCMATPFFANRFDKVKLLFTLMGVVGILSIAFFFVPKPETVGVVTLGHKDRAVSVTLAAEELLGESVAASDSIQWTRHKPSYWVFTKRIPLEETGKELHVVLPAKSQWVVSVVKTDPQGVLTDSATWSTGMIVIFLFNILISLALGPKSPLAWSMCADVADYNEWRTGRRATAMTFAATTFAQKMGGALGSFCMGLVLLSIGYAANEAQSGASENGILSLQTLFPGIFALLSVLALKFYNLDSKKLQQVQNDLEKRNS